MTAPVPLAINPMLQGMASATAPAADRKATREAKAWAQGQEFEAAFLSVPMTTEHIKYDPNGNQLFSTLYGGNGNDYGYGVTIDASGNIFVTGQTASTDFPTTAGAYHGPLSRLGAGPEAVARTIEKALTKSRPKARYPVTASARLMLAQHAILPDRAWDAMVGTTFPRPGR